MMRRPIRPLSHLGGVLRLRALQRQKEQRRTWKQKKVAPQQQKKEGICLVELGRFGDIINILPVAQYIHDHYQKPYFMVSRPFASVLEGIGYVEPYPTDLDYGKLPEALALAGQRFSHVVRGQIWGLNHNQEKRTAAFNLESWREAGMEKHFSDPTLLPVFDKRNPDRELALWNSLNLTTAKPVVLVNTTGSHSSPFPQGNLVLQEIFRHWTAQCELVDLALIKAERIYDVLGLFERAAVLVSIDTVWLHLAAATNIPVVAIINPKPWYGTICRGNCVAQLTYTEAENCPDQINRAIELALKPIRRQLNIRTPSLASRGTIFHAVERHDDDREEARKSMAIDSWDGLYQNHGTVPCHLWNYPRTAKTIGDHRLLPFLKDVLHNAMRQAGDDDIILWTNDDTILHPDLPDALRFYCGVYDCVTSQRCDFKEAPAELLSAPLAAWDSMKINRHIGRDLFAATKSWLNKHWNEIPDFVLGASEFDLCLAAIVRKYHNIPTIRQNMETPLFPAEPPSGYIGHVYHVPRWMSKDICNRAPAQIHNRRLFKTWAGKNMPGLKFSVINTI